MSTHFFQQSGNRIVSVPKNSLTHLDVLPGGTYQVCFNPERGYYLETGRPFSNPERMYGDVIKTSEKIRKTFARIGNRTLGVLLSGNKGSGKTLLARDICMKAGEDGIPTFIISSAFSGPDFNEFISSFHQQVIILVDEYEKTYSDDEDQEALLSLLDGVHQTPKLWILTCNDEARVNNHMINRPGRIRYWISYYGLERSFVEEYAEENLKDRTKKNVVQMACALFDSLNFDLLATIVDEINHSEGEDPLQVIQMLNARPFHSAQGIYGISLVSPEGKMYSSELLTKTTFKGNPVSLRDHYGDNWSSNQGSLAIGIEEEVKEILDSFHKEREKAAAAGKYLSATRAPIVDTIEFTADDFLGFDAQKYAFCFRGKAGWVLLLTPSRVKPFSWVDFSFQTDLTGSHPRA